MVLMTGGENSCTDAAEPVQLGWMSAALVKIYLLQTRCPATSGTGMRLDSRRISDWIEVPLRPAVAAVDLQRLTVLEQIADVDRLGSKRLGLAPAAGPIWFPPQLDQFG